MEADICHIVLKMYHGKSSAGASITSGGSESILMAIKAQRDKMRAENNIYLPEL